MRDDTRKNTKVISHINKENDYALSITNENLDLQRQLYNEIKGYYKETFKTYPLPYVSHDYKYYKHMVEGKSYPYYYQLNVHTQESILLLDVNEFALGHEQCDDGRIKILNCNLGLNLFM